VPVPVPVPCPPPTPPQDTQALAFTRSGGTLFAACHSGDVAVVRMAADARGGDMVATLQGHVQDCTTLALDPGDK
jgi:hypothetical protein